MQLSYFDPANFVRRLSNEMRLGETGLYLGSETILRTPIFSLFNQTYSRQRVQLFHRTDKSGDYPDGNYDELIGSLTFAKGERIDLSGEDSYFEQVDFQTIRPIVLSDAQFPRIHVRIFREGLGEPYKTERRDWISSGLFWKKTKLYLPPTDWFLSEQFPLAHSQAHTN